MINKQRPEFRLRIRWIRSGRLSKLERKITRLDYHSIEAWISSYPLVSREQIRRKETFIRGNVSRGFFLSSIARL